MAKEPDSNTATETPPPEASGDPVEDNFNAMLDQMADGTYDPDAAPPAEEEADVDSPDDEVKSDDPKDDKNTKPQDSTEHPDSDSDETWEKRYKDIQKHNSKLVDEKKELRKELSETLRSQPPAENPPPAEEKAPVEATADKHVELLKGSMSEEDLADFEANPWFEKAIRADYELKRKEFDTQFDGRVDALTEKRLEQDRTVQQQAFNDKVGEEVPEMFELVENPEFVDFVNRNQQTIQASKNRHGEYSPEWVKDAIALFHTYSARNKQVDANRGTKIDAITPSPGSTGAVEENKNLPDSEDLEGNLDHYISQALKEEK